VAREVLVVDVKDVGGKPCVIRKSGGVACQAKFGGLLADRVGFEGATSFVSGSPLCAAMKDGSVVCEDGSRPPKRVPPPNLAITKRCRGPGDGVCLRSDLRPLTNVVERIENCALTAEGEVLCWGPNTEGQVGDGTHMPRGLATPVLGLPPAAHIVEWGGARCALLRDGTPRCWGPFPPESWEEREGREEDDDGKEYLKKRKAAQAKGALYIISEGMEGNAHYARPVELPGSPKNLREIYAPDCTLTRDGRARCRGLVVDHAVSLRPLEESACAITEGGTAVCSNPNTNGKGAPTQETLRELVSDARRSL